MKLRIKLNNNNFLIISDEIVLGNNTEEWRNYIFSQIIYNNEYIKCVKTCGDGTKKELPIIKHRDEVFVNDFLINNTLLIRIFPITVGNHIQISFENKNSIEQSLENIEITLDNKSDNYIKFVDFLSILSMTNCKQMTYNTEDISYHNKIYYLDNNENNQVQIEYFNNILGVIRLCIK